MEVRAHIHPQKSVKLHRLYGRATITINFRTCSPPHRTLYPPTPSPRSHIYLRLSGPAHADSSRERNHAACHLCLAPFTQHVFLRFTHVVAGVRLGTPHFTALRRYCFFFTPMKGWGNPTSVKSIGTIFPTALARFVSVPHFGSSCNISNLLVTDYGDR